MTTSTTKETYGKLCGLLKEVSTLKGIAGLLSWDEMVMMPPGASNERGAQKAILTGVIYDKETSKELGSLLQELSADEKLSELDDWAKANIRDAKKDFVRSTAIPKDLATRIATHETDAYVAWVAAKKSSDFSLFAPALQKWVDLSLEKAKAIDPDKPAYDVLLDTFEKGSSSARLEAVFQDVKAAVVPLLAKIKAKGPGFITDDCIKGSYDISTQSEMCKSVALDIGFSLETGRLDVSVHPFTGGAHPTDVRMTTRFKQEDLLEGLTGAVHETGHALYEQGRNKDQDGLPASVALSMGIHESQSLLWERMVFLGRPAQTYMLHKLVSFFPETFGGKGLSAQDLYKATNVVKDVSLIRVEADEVNYPLHVIIRYEIETGLLNGTVKVEDVPRLWNEKMQAYLGVVPPNDAQGCLQDIHWSMGALGYFPTYLLGAACAAQIFECAHESIPDLDKLLADGDFSPLKLWLNEKVHHYGSFHASADELIKAVTGKPLDPKIFIKYLETKYAELYDLSMDDLETEILESDKQALPILKPGESVKVHRNNDALLELEDIWRALTNEGSILEAHHLVRIAAAIFGADKFNEKDIVKIHEGMIPTPPAPVDWYSFEVFMAKNQASLRIYLVDGSMRFIDMCRAYKRKWQVDRMLKKVQPQSKPVDAIKEEAAEEGGYNSDPNPTSNVTKASVKQAPSWEADIDKVLEEKSDKNSKQRQWKKVATNLIAEVLGEGGAVSDNGVSEGRHVVAAAHASGAAGALTLDPLSPLHFRPAVGQGSSNRISMNGGTAMGEKRTSFSGALQQMGGDIRARAMANGEYREGVGSPRGPALVSPMHSGALSPDSNSNSNSNGGDRASLGGKSLLMEPLPTLSSPKGPSNALRRTASPPRLSPVHVDHSKRVDIAALLGSKDKTWNPPPRMNSGEVISEGGSGSGGARMSMDGELHRGKFLPALGPPQYQRENRTSNAGAGESILVNALPALRSRSPMGERGRPSKGGDEGLTDDGRRSEPRKRPSPLSVGSTF